MKKLIFLVAFLISLSSFGQVVKMQVEGKKAITEAQMNALVVPSGEYWEVTLDTGAKYKWDGDSWETVNTQNLTSVSRVISGGMQWTTGLTYESVDLVYVSSTGTTFNIADGTQVTLDAADGSNPRIDLIYGDDTGTLGKSTGTPAAVPTANTLPSYQLQLKIALVGTGATTPTDVAIRTVYEENLGQATEFDATENTGGARISVANATTPLSGSVDIKTIAALNDADIISFVHTTPTSFDALDNIELSIKNLAAWGNDYFFLELKDGSATVAGVTIGSSFLNKSDITNTQTVTVFKSDLTITNNTQFDRIDIYNRIIGSSTILYQIDDIYIHEDSGSTQPTVVTASNVTVNTSNFSGVLSSEDDTAQKAFDKLDDYVPPGGGDMLSTNNLSDVVDVPTARVNLGLNTTANQTDSADKRFVTDAQEAKIDFISITQAVDLDQMETDVTANNAKISNVPTALSTGTVTNTTYGITSDGGTDDVVLPQAVASTSSGLMSGTDKAKLDGIEALADITDATNVNAAGAVMETDYDANTILAATSDNTPATLTVGEQTFVGRVTGGNITALTQTQAHTLLNDRILENATVTTTQTLDYAAYEIFNFTVTGDVTFSESNLPTSGSYGKIIVLNITGDHALTYPAGWSTNITGAYDGTVNNVIVVWYIKSGTYKVQITQPD